MAKVGLILKGATGKLAGMTLQKGADGATIARETVTPKNPNTDAQKIQRTIIATIGKAYGKMRNICDHSFEGYSNGAACMNRFRKLNARKLREYVASEMAAGTDPATIFDFTPVGSQRFALGSFVLSAGSLPTVHNTLDVLHNRNTINAIDVAQDAIPTYQQVCDALGLKRGDQLTFCYIILNTANEFEFKFARIVLSPWDQGVSATMSTPFLTLTGGVYSLNAANPRNEGSLTYGVASDKLTVAWNPDEGTMGAAAVIASRKVNDSWLRSAAEFAAELDSPLFSGRLVSLYEAISDTKTYVDVESPYFLNNAEG